MGLISNLRVGKIVQTVKVLAMSDYLRLTPRILMQEEEN